MILRDDPASALCLYSLDDGWTWIVWFGCTRFGFEQLREDLGVLTQQSLLLLEGNLLNKVHVC